MAPPTQFSLHSLRDEPAAIPSQPVNTFDEGRGESHGYASGSPQQVTEKIKSDTLEFARILKAAGVEAE